MTTALGAKCTAATDCAASACCNAVYGASTFTTLSTISVCVAAGSAKNAALTNITAVGATTATQIPLSFFTTTTCAASPCSGYNFNTACAAAKTGASQLVASAAVVATAVYMM